MRGSNWIWVDLLFLVLCLISLPARAQDAPVSIPPTLSGPLEISFHEKFLGTPGPALATVGPGAGYASLRYSIGLPNEKQNIEQVLRYLAQVFPQRFGNSSGTYTITISVADVNGKVLAKMPILSFQWTKEAGFLFFEKTVSQIQQTTWKGTLVNEMLLSPATQRLKVSVEVYSQSDRSLDFAFAKKTATTFSAGALASYFPLPAAAIPLLDAVTGLISDIYSNSKKADLIDAEEIVMVSTKAPIKSAVTIKDSQGGIYSIPVYLSVDVEDSRIIGGNLQGGKFGKDQFSISIFDTLALPMGEGKSVSVVELISSSESANIKTARPLLDAVLSGVGYGKDPTNKKEQDIGARCGSLYAALNTYLSRYDARAMFYGFVKTYGDRIKKDDCVGARQDELSSVGLDVGQ